MEKVKAQRVGTSTEYPGGPEPKEGYSVWIESGVWYTSPTVDPKKFGGHAYDDGGYEQGIRDCSCGTYMLGSSSGGQTVDPFGACPNNPIDPKFQAIAEKWSCSLSEAKRKVERTAEILRLSQTDALAFLAEVKPEAISKKRSAA